MGEHRITKTDVLSDGFRTLKAVTVELPDGDTMRREVLEMSAAVALLPYDPERRTAILTRQFRTPPFLTAGQRSFVEAPAGMLDKEGDDPQSCARREAMEEIGLKVRQLEPLGPLWSSPGVTTEVIHLFLAPYALADRVEEGGGLAEEHEDITVLELPLADVARMLASGEIADLKTLALVQALQLRRPELFQ